MTESRARPSEPIVGNLYAPPTTNFGEGARRSYPVPSGLYYAYNAIQLMQLAMPWVIHALYKHTRSEWFSSFAEGRRFDALYVIVEMLPILFLIVEAGIWAAWNRRQWRRLPKRRRRIGRRTMTPNQVTLRWLIPFYSLYWSFVFTRALCERIDDVSSGEGRGCAPTLLARICPVISLVYAFGFTVMDELISLYSIAAAYTVLWSVYMYRVERSWSHTRKPRPAIRATRGAHANGEELT